MMLHLHAAAQLMQGRYLGPDERGFDRVSTDTRDILPGDLFFALKGERFDAHDFAAQALEQGAAAVVVSRELPGLAAQIVVGDTLQALSDLAAAWRVCHREIPLIGVTGSNGKTTLKEMLVSIARVAVGEDAVHATRGNLNNHIGLPLTLLGIRETHQIVIAEMGMNHFGEIDLLTRLAQPDVAVINNAGAAHLEALGSVAGVAKAKGEIFAGLREHGTAVINADDEFASYWAQLAAGHKQLTFGLDAADVRASQIKTLPVGSSFILDLPRDDAQITLQVPGEHNVRNALAAAACALALDLDISVIAEGLNSYQGVKGRLQAKRSNQGALVLDDTYNANPDSMKAAVKVLAGQAAPRILVLGDMAEVGDDSPARHAEIGSFAREHGIDHLLTFGRDMQHAANAFGCQHFTEFDDLIDALQRLITPESTVLVKGSRSMRMERVVEALTNNNKAVGEK